MAVLTELMMEALPSGVPRSRPCSLPGLELGLGIDPGLPLSVVPGMESLIMSESDKCRLPAARLRVQAVPARVAACIEARKPLSVVLEVATARDA